MYDFSKKQHWTLTLLSCLGKWTIEFVYKRFILYLKALI